MHRRFDEAIEDQSGPGLVERLAYKYSRRVPHKIA
jgi:hypothetical protein